MGGFEAKGKVWGPIVSRGGSRLRASILLCFSIGHEVRKSDYFVNISTPEEPVTPGFHGLLIGTVNAFR
jgi:hypothetical protein